MTQQDVQTRVPAGRSVTAVAEVPLYSVATVGFSEVERNVLDTIFSLSARRNLRFIPFVHNNSSAAPDLLVIDADQVQFSQVVQAFATKYRKRPRVVLVGQVPANTGYPSMPRPLRWTRTLQLLEQTMLGANRVERVATRSERVLVVDDSLVVRKSMESRLAPFGFDVDYAETGEQAIGWSGEKQYTCVFLDVVLPGMDGYQVCKAIKAKKRAGKAPAVVMLTSRGSTFDKIRGAIAGCDAYLIKPVDEEKLLKTIGKFLPASEALKVPA